MAFKFVIVAVFAAFVIGVIVGWCNLPVVQFSWSTGECIQVIGGSGDCNTLPEKYVHQWVK